MIQKVCLLTPGQPSTNPRLVKEADALTERGYAVHVLCAFRASWALDTDEVLLKSRRWSWSFVGGHPRFSPFRYQWTRLRHGMSRQLLPLFLTDPAIRHWAFCRVLPELEHQAERTKADLYIAHYPEALPAAVPAAQKNHARVGFDAEDFHSSGKNGRTKKGTDRILEAVEHFYLPQCHYITTSSPQIAEVYQKKYQIPKPATLLNVFPLSHRPKEGFRSSSKKEVLSLYWFSQTIGPNRGLEDIVKALGLLQKFPIELHLRGIWQKGYQKQLFKMASEAGVALNRIATHPPVPPEEMVQCASQYDIGLALEPSNPEKRNLCLTNKIMTYLLAGNAVVATATTAQQFLMREIASAGFSYEPGNMVHLAEGLKYWCENRMALEHARQAAWDWGTCRYNWDLEKEKFLQLVEDVLKKH